MKKNMGMIDRIARIAVAAVIGVAIFMNYITGTVAIVLAVLAGVFVLTSIISFCPLYVPLKINTDKK